MRFITAFLFPPLETDRTALKRALVIGAFIHLIAVIFSDGYHRTDEFHSVANFLFYKLGFIPESDLVSVNWEYDAAIRSWIQPAIYFLLIKPFTFLGLRDPFIILTIARFVSSLLALLSTTLFIWHTKDLFKNLYHKQAYMLLSYTIWFFPFFHARTTAENLGMSFFIFGLIFFIKGLPTSTEALIGSTLLALSVPLRIPMAPTVIAVYLWLFFVNKSPKDRIYPVIVGSVLAIIITITVDSWGYQKTTFSVFNYIWAEFTRGVSKGYGVDPWWRYFELIFSRGIPPLSILFIFSFIFFWIKRPLHLFTFVTLSLFLLHSLTSHKELRFIFGLSSFLPLFIVMAYSDLSPKLESVWWKRTALLLVVINLFLLFGASVKSPFRQIGFYKYLYNMKESPSEILTIHDISQPLTFLLKKPITFKKIINPEEDLKGFVATENIREMKYFMQKRVCKLLYQPLMAELLIKTGKAKFDKIDFWSLFHCL